MQTVVYFSFFPVLSIMLEIGFNFILPPPDPCMIHKTRRRLTILPAVSEVCHNTCSTCHLHTTLSIRSKSNKHTSIPHQRKIPLRTYKDEPSLATPKKFIVARQIFFPFFRGGNKSRKASRCAENPAVDVLGIIRTTGFNPIRGIVIP